MKSLFKRAIRRLFPSVVERECEAWKSDRVQDVYDALSHEISPVVDQPMIHGGTYDWRIERPVELDFFFPEAPLAVRVTNRTFGPWSDVSNYSPSRRFWEAATEDEFFVVDACQRAQIPLLLITPDDPVSPHALRVAITNLLS